MFENEHLPNGYDAIAVTTAAQTVDSDIAVNTVGQTAARVWQWSNKSIDFLFREKMETDDKKIFKID